MQPLPVKSRSSNYVFIVNGTRIEIEDEILAKIKTLANMVIDVDSEELQFDRSTAIPLKFDDITSEVFLQAIIDFYRSPPIIRPRFFKPQYSRDELIQFVRVASVLDAEEFLLFALDQVHDYFHRLPFKQLQEEATRLETKKRKKKKAHSIEEEDDDDDDVATDERLRLQYRRALYTHRILSALLPEELVRGISPFIRKYISPVASRYGTLSVIQHADGVLVYDDFALSKVAHDAKDSIRQCQPSDEILIGDTYVGYLSSKDSSLYAYRNEDDILFLTKNVIAAWPSTHGLAVLKSEGLYAYSFSSTQQSERIHVSRVENVMPADVIQAFIFNTALCVLMHNGDLLYYPAPYNIITEGTRQTIYHLEASDRLFAPQDTPLIQRGTDGVFLRATGFGYTLSWNTEGAKTVQSVATVAGNDDSPPPTPIMMKFVFEHPYMKLYVSDDDRVYIEADASPGAFQVLKQRNGLFGGEIVGIGTTRFSMNQDGKGGNNNNPDHDIAIIIATKEAYYVVAHTEEVVKLFGTSAGDLLNLSPFQLTLRPLPWPHATKPNKKPRLSCMVCSATAELVDRTTLSTVWCSHYCKLSQSIK